MISLLAALASLAASTVDSLVPPADTVEARSAAPVVASKTRSTAPSSFERYGRWQFGLSGGQSSGGGLALRYWLDERNGFEIHGYGYVYKREMPSEDDLFMNNHGADDYYYGNDTGTVSEGEISLGVQYLHEVLRFHLFDANGLIKGPSHLRGLTFAGVGGSAKYEDRNLRNGSVTSGSFYDYSYYANKRQYHRDVRHLFGGAGGGLEVELGRFSAHLLLGMGGEYSLSSDSYGVGPTADGGVFVRF